jgi:hypothetical protein
VGGRGEEAPSGFYGIMCRSCGDCAVCKAQGDALLPWLNSAQGVYLWVSELGSVVCGGGWLGGWVGGWVGGRWCCGLCAGESQCASIWYTHTDGSHLDLGLRKGKAWIVQPVSRNRHCPKLARLPVRCILLRNGSILQ